MRNAAIVASAAALFAAGAAFGQGTVELRIVASDNSGNPAGITNDTGSEDQTSAAPGTPYSQVFYLQARQVGDGLANGISAFDVSLTSSDGGTFSAVGLSFTEQGIMFPGSDFVASGDNGMFENFRSTIQADNSNPGNGGNGTDTQDGPSLSLLPLDLAQGGRGEGEGVWVNVYKFQYDTTLQTENVVISATGGSAGYWNDLILVQPVDVADAGYTIEIPAPGAAALLGLGGLVAIRRRR